VFDSLAETLAQTIQANPWLAPAAALGGGMLTAANPCVLAMVPLMVAYIAGQQTRSVGRSFLLSLTFTGGLTAMFAILFLITTAVSLAIQPTVWTYVAAGVCLLMGLHLIGLLAWQVPGVSLLRPRQRGLLGALLLGLLFGLASMPCAGPVLVALLAIVPLKGVAFGGLLLVAYSLGHCGLVLAGGTSMGLVQRLADSKGWNRSLEIMRRLAGVVIVLVGLLLLFS
jgi:cytochrome c-type biogenesis protein